MAATDAELIDRFRGGDQDAFTELVTRHERRVYNLAYRMLGRAEDARDAAQDAFLSCYRHLASFRGEAAFTTWLHRITVNACYDSLRRRPPDPAPLSEVPEPSPARDHADQAAAAVDVQRALGRVPVEFRAALVLHDIQGLPYEEVAEALEVPIGTIKSRIHRGRLALARALSGEPDHATDTSNRAAGEAGGGRHEPVDAPAASGPTATEDDR
jgi:RNA polymerase sigma-70 factor (ECF subfamily)